ncbi:MAG: hypothetical protein K5867_00345 [Bacteroidales bacterium]|nr:hypothetical protein [Bacteroidales bacterium]
MLKPFTLFAFVLLLPMFLLAQKESSVLKKADKMVASRQYESAYRLLDEYDPANDRVAVVLKKEDILLNYFAQSINHKVFSLKDLDEGETLQSVRQSFEMGNLYVFNADSVIRRLLVSHPGDCRLLNGYVSYMEALLGDYGFDFWSSSMDSSLSLMFQAASVSCNNAAACCQLGLYYHYYGVLDSASCYYRLATTLCDTLWHAVFNLGLIEFYDMSMQTEGLRDLHKSLKGYSIPFYKARVARALGIIYDEELHIPDSAHKYYSMAVDIDGDDMTNCMFLAIFYASRNDQRVFDAMRDAWRAGIEHDVLWDNLEWMFMRVKDVSSESVVVDFLKRMRKETDTPYEQGICCLFLGNYAEDDNVAVNYYNQAIGFFRMADAPDYFINDILEKIEIRTNQP